MGDLVRAYRLYRRMILYPHLLDEMRRLFLSALVDQGIASLESIRREAFQRLQEDNLELDEETARECADALIDLYFARHFGAEQAENYINLARKKDAFLRLNKVVNREGVSFPEIRQALREFCEIPQGDLHLSPNEAEGVRVALIKHLISDQLGFIGIAKQHITIRDIDEMLEHSCWNRRRPGKVGGKAAGMFLAHKIILPRLGKRDPELDKYVAVPESYYFNSGVLSDFIDHNGLYFFHSQKYKNMETLQEDFGKMAEILVKTSFPSDVLEDFRSFLQKIGEVPLILRSSSLLEDNLEFTFSGKYDSIFIPNRGDLETRLDGFTWGLKQVLMSTFSPAAIFYRRDHNLIDFDERMSILVQKVVGRRFGDYFFPFAAGVAFSRSSYAWSPRIVKEEGIIRLVLGLGTRAVDRTEPDYPRMIPLSHPLLRPEVTADQIKKYSQKRIDVLNLRTGLIETIPYLSLFQKIEHPDIYYAASVESGEDLSPPLFRGQDIDVEHSCITFENFLVKTPFLPLMKKTLKKLEQAYGRPVEVEFAWDEERLYILQCRSLAVTKNTGKVVLPKHVRQDRILFSNDTCLSSTIVKDIEYIVYVDPRAYAQIARYDERIAVARAVGKLNRILDGKRFALLGPARWGSNDTSFGVKVGYEDINRALILGEIAFEEEGLKPEVSYGTHFFNDLVEAQIYSLAIYPDHADMIMNEEFLLNTPNQLVSLAPDLASCEPVVHVIHVPSSTDGRFLQVFQDSTEQRGIGFFARPGEFEAAEEH